MAANTFSEAVRGVHRELVQVIDVSNLLLVDLKDKGVLTDAQYRHLSVSNQLCVLFKLLISTKRTVQPSVKMKKYQTFIIICSMHHLNEHSSNCFNMVDDAFLAYIVLYIFHHFLADRTNGRAIATLLCLSSVVGVVVVVCDVMYCA